MFEKVSNRPEDPIDTIARYFKEDQNPNKTDLGAGVYRDENGDSPVMRAITKAEQRLTARRDSKEYLTPAGNIRYCELTEPYLFGDKHNRSIVNIQTSGGGPALRAAGDLIKRLSSTGNIWVPEPTWQHQALVFNQAGITVKSYSYYNRESNTLVFPEMLDSLEQASEGDVVLLHGCCHNPTGADLSEQQWDACVELFERKNLIPLIDIAYQGFGRGIEEDSYGVRVFTKSIPEMIVASTSSKSFAIYRERAGMISLVSDINKDSMNQLRKEVLEVTRSLYFMPANHGAALVVEILEDPDLVSMWREEVGQIRKRIIDMRAQLSRGLNDAFGLEAYSYIEKQSGMFSLLPLDAEQLDRLRTEFSVYMIPGGRINVAGLAEKSMANVIEGILAVS